MLGGSCELNWVKNCTYSLGIQELFQACNCISEVLNLLVKPIYLCGGGIIGLLSISMRFSPLRPRIFLLGGFSEIFFGLNFSLISLSDSFFRLRKFVLSVF
jgi:hypothetical protein